MIITEMSGSHSSSDDSNDSRKRPPDPLIFPDTSPKRANCGYSSVVSDKNMHLKVLIPSIAAGAVIGKSGEAIGKIQKDTNTKVKISKQDEFYPGTTERVCLIIGSIDGVMSVHNYIMDRIMEKPDPNPHATGEGRLNVERHKQVKILVPNSTAGMVIGKGGSYIQEIKDKTGAYVQISQKSREFNLFERCIIIAGDLDQTRAAVQLILAVIAADPQSASCPNLSYHDVRGPVASVYPTGSPYATPMIPCPATPSWMAAGGSPVDPTTASAAAAMMAAMFSPGTVPAVGSAPGTRSSTFDFTSLAVLASNQHALGLTPMLQPIALPSPGANAATTPQWIWLVHPAPLTVPVQLNQRDCCAGTLDPGSVMTARQAALLASIGSKPQLVPQDMPQLTDTMPHSAFISQSAMLPPSSTTSSLAAGMALAALSAAASGSNGTCTSTGQPVGMLPNPGALLGIVPSMVPSLPGTAQPSRNDQLSLASPPSLLLALNEPSSRLSSAPAGGASPAAAMAAALGAAAAAAAASVSVSSANTPPSVTAASATGPMFGLYALPSPSSSSLSASPVAASVGSYLLYKKDIAVPESVIGLILGPQGRSIIDLQSSTGTIIQISQKGVYLTGTQNRLVTITGAQPNVQWAADVIEQRLQAERIRRESTTSNQTTPPPPTAATTGPSAGSNQSDIERQRTLSLFYQQQTSSGLYADSQLSVSSSIPISATSGVSCLSAGMPAVPAPAGESTIVQPQSQNPTTSLHSAKRDSDTHGFRQAS
ncbi:RNA-binding protein Nova [Fasciola gigantica]|uniref:RNA-binding protein Nova n=1 Tax=Fasciola gigantica TaxID=46835 RepID=A0A504YC19_FASGI|nr:RNA-binding protein Nova [Fasciola gigantica]